MVDSYDMGDGSIPTKTVMAEGGVVYGSSDPGNDSPSPFSRDAVAQWLAAAIQLLLDLSTTDISGYVAPVNPDWNSTTGLSKILNKPAIPGAQVNADWTASSGVARILNKPTIPPLLEMPKVTHQFLVSIASDGTVEADQVDFTDLSGKLAASQALDLTSQKITVNGSTATIDLNSGRYVILTLNHDVTAMTISNWRPDNQVDKVILEVRNTGSYVISNWGGALPSAGSAPTITSGNGKIDKFVISTGDGGTTKTLDVIGQDYHA
jgi:hypothetical protein